MIHGEIQLKHPEIDMDQFYQDLGKVIGYVAETEKHIDSQEKTM